jgi:antitoxin component YwqK of YwqJK toxin-antitoxin module
MEIDMDWKDFGMTMGKLFGKLYIRTISNVVQKLYLNIDMKEVIRRYYSNGQICWETPYVNGNRYGLERFWYDNGQIIWETPYVNGKRHGLTKAWYSNANLHYEIPYKNNLQCGAKIIFKY